MPLHVAYGMEKRIIQSVAVTGSAVQAVDFTGLQGNKARYYRLKFKIKQGHIGLQYYFIYVNGDYTNANYYQVSAWCDYGSLLGAGENLPKFCQGANVTHTFHGELRISKDILGRFVVEGIVLQSKPADSNKACIQWGGVYKVASISEITSLRICAEYAGGIDVGSEFLLEAIF